MPGPGDTWGFGNFQIYWGGPESPDSVQLYSTTVLLAAPQAEIASTLPRPGSNIILQLNIPQVFVFDAVYQVKRGDTPASVAAALTAIINNGAGNPDDVAAMQAANVVAANTVGSAIIAVTQPPWGGMTLGDASGLTPSPFKVISTQSSSAWDAGPISAIGKLPVDAQGKGIAPPVGSNIGQVVIAAYNTDGVALQFMTIGFNVIDPATGECELAVYTADTTKKILSLTSGGLNVNGKQLA
jgi:hypothetical protein